MVAAWIRRHDLPVLRGPLFALFALGAAGGLVAERAGAQDRVLLNEIMADPNRDWDLSGAFSSRDDEWVEIVNAGSIAVDLAGYRLAGADTSWRYEFSGLLAPGQVRVVYGGASYAWEVAHKAPAFGLRLTNTGGTLALWKRSDVDSVRVDVYTYADHEAEDDRSSGRVPDGGPEWRLFDGLNPYVGASVPAGTGCAPSPGAPVGCATDVLPGTWGQVKALFRRQDQER